MSWTLTTSGSAVSKAGLHVNSNIIVSGSTLQKWSDEVEGRITAECRRDWVGQYSGLSTEIKSALSDVASSEIAKRIIMYDVSGYLGTEAQLMLNLNDDIVQRGLNALKDFKSNEIKTP